MNFSRESRISAHKADGTLRATSATSGKHWVHGAAGRSLPLCFRIRAALHQVSRQFAVTFLSVAITLLADVCRGQSLSNITFMAFDQETTGLDTKYDRVIEIGVVKFRNGTIIDSTNWLINPGIRIPEAARQVNGITDKMVAGSPSFSEVYHLCTNVVGQAVLLAHNARFDAAIFASEIRRNNLSPPGNTFFDTLPLTRKWFPNAESHELSALAAHLKLENIGFHRARQDAKYLAEIFIIGLKQLPANADLSDLQTLAGTTFQLGVAPTTRNETSGGKITTK